MSSRVITKPTSYSIRGGVDGRERLRLLARTLAPTTAALFDRVGIGEGMRCLDVGCGGGDVTLELARRVGPQGRVVGIDIDETKLALARAEADEQRAHHVVYRCHDARTAADAPARPGGPDGPGEPEGVGEGSSDSDSDIVYARFLLSHLSKPEAIVAALVRRLRPGGRLIVEDIDASGTFSWPESTALRRYRELYAAVVHARGGDPDIGPKLPALLMDAGLADVDVQLVQPMGLRGTVKSIHAITMENIADAAVADGLASREECDTITSALHACAADPRMLMSLPRIVQTWGRRPA